MAGVELRLFGVARLQLGSEAVHVGARKALAVLALLAIDGTCSRGKLAMLLWPEAAAAAALRNLRQELFRLRRLGAAPQAMPERCVALPSSLRVDVIGFRRAVAAGDRRPALALAAATALEGLDGAAGEAFDAWLERSRWDLLQQRRLARAELALQLEQAGDALAALALHQQAFAEDGCDEAAACQAMRLHIVRGERAAAAATLSRLTRCLHDELDLAPGAETAALAGSLPASAETPSPIVPPPPPALPEALLPERLPFVGRDAERDRIIAAWTTGRRVWLSGVAGSGKTRLASLCAADRGAWLLAACEPADAGQPYASALRVLRALHGAAGDSALPPWVLRELGWVMPEMLPEPARRPPPVAGAEAGERLHAAIAAAWQQWAGDNFDAIVLDDWQWADDTSVSLWQRVDLRGVTTIVAYRSAQLSAAALAAQRAEVDRGSAVIVEVDALSRADTLALVRSASASPGGALFASRLHAATAGNPFFLVETLRHLSLQGQLVVASDGRWSTPYDESTADYSELPVPPSVRAVVLGRVRALGDVARRLLEAASLLGERFDARLLEGTTDADATAIAAVLEHAEAARLVVAEGPQYRFAHDLVWNGLASSLSPARRRLLHARLARRLEDTDAAPALVALQLEAAGEDRAAVVWRLRAAAAAWRAHALAETRQHCRQALADGACAGDAVQAQSLLAEVERYCGDGAACAAAAQAAVDAARAVDAATWLDARLAQLRCWMATERGSEMAAALDVLAAELAVAAPAQRSRAAALRAKVLYAAGQAERARVLEDEAIAWLEGQAQAHALQAELLSDAFRTATAMHDFPRVEALAARALAAAQCVGDDAMHARALVARGIAATLCRNGRAAAESAYERARFLARRCGHVPQQWAAIFNLIELHAHAGHADAMSSLLDEAAALAPGHEPPRIREVSLESRYYVHYLRGDIAAAREAAEELIDFVKAVDDPYVRSHGLQFVLDLYLHTGDLATAERLLDAAGEAADLGINAVLTAKRAWLETARGNPAGALALLDACATPGRAEDRLVAAWVGAACALELGDAAGAARRLQDIDIAAELPVDALAMLLVQRLRLAGHLDRDDLAARTRAAQLLPRVPALEAALLREALGG